MKKITKTDISTTLKESVFDPKEKSPLSVVVEMANPDYYERKAQELIMESYQEKHHDKHDSKIKQAITLLALARAYRKKVQREKAKLNGTQEVT